MFSRSLGSSLEWLAKGFNFQKPLLVENRILCRDRSPSSHVLGRFFPSWVSLFVLGFFLLFSGCSLSEIDKRSSGKGKVFDAISAKKGFVYHVELGIQKQDGVMDGVFLDERRFVGDSTLFMMRHNLRVVDKVVDEVFVLDDVDTIRTTLVDLSGARDSWLFDPYGAMGEDQVVKAACSIENAFGVGMKEICEVSYYDSDTAELHRKISIDKNLIIFEVINFYEKDTIVWELR